MDEPAVHWFVLTKHTLLYAVDFESTKVDSLDQQCSRQRRSLSCPELNVPAKVIRKSEYENG